MVNFIQILFATEPIFASTGSACLKRPGLQFGYLTGTRPRPAARLVCAVADRPCWHRAGAGAGHRRCRTAAAGCTAESPWARRKVTGTH